MPVCDVPVGSKAKAAIQPIANWAAAAATLGTGDAFPIVSEDVTRIPDNLSPESLIGTPWRLHPLRTGWTQQGTIDVEMDYRRYMRNFALAMGIAGTPAVAEAAVRWIHTLDMDEELCDIVATIGIDKRIKQNGDDTGGWVWGKAKANGFVLEGRQGAVLRAQFRYLMRDLARAMDPTGWTHLYDPVNAWQYCLPSQGVWRASVQGDPALDSGDVIPKPTSYQITYNGNLAGEKVEDDEIDEPIRQGFGDVKLRLEFARPTQALHELFMDAHEAEPGAAGALLKLDAVFTGSALGTGNRKMSLLFPSLSVERCSPTIRDAGPVPLVVELHAAGSDGTVLGMTGFTAPMRILFENELSTDPLS